MKIKTLELVRLINIVVKAAGNNKLIPITQMIGIKCSEGKLTLSATDSFNYMYVHKQIESDDKMNICVPAETLSKLVNKFTCEETEIKLTDNYLSIIGNGEYKLNLLLDDEGKAFKFPTKECSKENCNTQDIDLVKFTNTKFYGEKSLAQTMEEPDLIAYFVNDKYAISTDRNIMTLYKESISNVPLTLRSKFVELISVMKEKIKFINWKNEVTGEMILYVSDGEIEIYSKINGNVEDYPYEAIQNLIENTEFKTSAKVSVKELTAVLDRISLMVTPYDSNVIDLKLNADKLFISSVKSTGIETVILKDITGNSSWSGKIDIEMLKSQLTSFVKDEITIYLGNDTCIKLIEGNVTKLICLVAEA